jgi:peptide deformylase
METPRTLKIIRMGDPVLTATAKEVQDPKAPEVQKIISDMLETAHDYGNLAGLAAPQVKISYRIVLFYLPKEQSDEMTLTLMINPTWEPCSEDMGADWEGCLSIPGLVGYVPRYTHIRYSYSTPQGELIHTEATGFHARVVQHECDHLDGRLYPQRMSDMSRMAYVEEFRQFLKPKVASAG